MEGINKKLERLESAAYNCAIKHAEKLARNVLFNNPDKLGEFVMGMGSYFFCDTKDDIIHTSMGSNLNRLRRMKGYTKFQNFVRKWDHKLKLTGTPMRIKQDGSKITDW